MGEKRRRVPSRYILNEAAHRGISPIIDVLVATAVLATVIHGKTV